jgi:hypothetical protein
VRNRARSSVTSRSAGLRGSAGGLHGRAGRVGAAVADRISHDPEKGIDRKASVGAMPPYLFRRKRAISMSLVPVPERHFLTMACMLADATLKSCDRNPTSSACICLQRCLFQQQLARSGQGATIRWGEGAKKPSGNGQPWGRISNDSRAVRRSGTFAT